MPLTAQADAPKVQAAIGIGGVSSIGQWYQYQEGTARNRAMSLATVSRSRDLLASVIACMPLQMYNEVYNDSTGEMEQVPIAPRSWLRQPDPTVTYNFLMNQKENIKLIWRNLFKIYRNLSNSKKIKIRFQNG